MVNGQKEAEPGKRRSVLIDIYPSWEEVTAEFVKCRPSKKPISTKTNVQNELQVRPLKIFTTEAKLYIPSTLNIDFILWHTQLIVCAVEC